jgi:muconate cycloisomerase
MEMEMGDIDLKTSEGPKIVRIELIPLKVPFWEFVKKTMAAGAGGVGMAIPVDEPWEGGEFVIARLTAEDGNEGLGEAFVWLPETGTTPGQIIGVIEAALGKYVLGESPFNVEAMLDRMDRNVNRSEVAKGLLDMACYDLMGKIAGKSASEIMGGPGPGPVPLCALVPLMDLEIMAQMAESFVKQGYGTLRIKLGRSVDEDVKIMERLRAAAGDRVRLRVDYNQAYRPEEAARAIRAIEPFRVDVAEQPVRSADFLGMAWVQKQVDTPLMAHESCFSLTDIAVLIELQAIGVVGINSERPGGVTNALRAVSYAQQRGLSCLLHNQPLGIASAMHLHLACARRAGFTHATELFGFAMLEDDLIAEPISYENGSARPPAGPGWGVELDREALAKYAAGPTVKLELKGRGHA